MSFLGVSLGIGVAGAVGKVVTGLHQNHLANQIQPQWQQYTTSPFAKSQLGLAQQLFNGRMPGATDEERNILASQANYQNDIARNATDSSQALALGGLSQGITNNSFNQLGIDEQKSKLGFLDNLNQAYQTMIGEGNKEYQSMEDKYNSDVNAKTALRNASAQNMFSGFSDLGSDAFMGNQYGLFGQTPWINPNRPISLNPPSSKTQGTNG